jgi:hypothetical protein
MQIVHTDKGLITADLFWQTTDPSSHQRERPHKKTCNSLTVIKIWSEAQDWCFIPR